MTNTWYDKHILKIRDDRTFRHFELTEEHAKKLLFEPDKAEKKFTAIELRKEIEPWLTALFQSEHLSLFTGAGLSSAVHEIATGTPGVGMNGSRFSIFDKQINLMAKESAKKTGRGKSNIEDTIRVANNLLEGLKIYTSVEGYGVKKLRRSLTIDLSLVPPEIVHIITAVIARMTLEALQRYRKLEGKSLPTVLVMEEAHTFIKRYKEEEENQNAASVCCQVFEKIAREGRKFGLGLVLSSQRPSELSPTVLSQCNTFLLHRINNDRDQEQVAKLVPDNLRGMLRELPVLPSQYAILLGWASELPVLVRMNDLAVHEAPPIGRP